MDFPHHSKQSVLQTTLPVTKYENEIETAEQSAAVTSVSAQPIVTSL